MSRRLAAGIAGAGIAAAVSWSTTVRAENPPAPRPAETGTVGFPPALEQFELVTDGQPIPAVVDSSDLAPFWAAARERRVDVIGISDSNQIHHGAGWDQGFNVALAERFAMYATPLVSCRAGAPPQGHRSGAIVLPSAIPIQPPLPGVFLATWSSIEAVVPSGIGNLAPGAVFGPQLIGIGIESDSPVGPTGPLRFYFSYGASLIDGGGFRPQFRYNGPYSYGGWQQGDWVSSYSPAGPEMRMATFDVPAGDRQGNAVYGGLTRPAGDPIVGPLFMALMRAENTDCRTGCSYSTLVYDGGRSLRSMASRLIGMNLSQLQYYFTELTRQQNSPDKMLLVCVNSGFNDPIENLPSLGPANVLDSTSAAAYADNLRALMARITQAWTACGFDENGLYFLIFPSHPIPPDVIAERLESYRAAARNIAASYHRVASVDLSRLLTWQDMIARGYYYAGFIDTYHLSDSGYENLSRMILQALDGPVAGGDTTADGRVDLSDIADVIGHWGAERAPAWLHGDADGDGAVGLADLAVVIRHYGR